MVQSGKPGIRAAKACKRCSQRKVKCDAIKNGLPCSRCRMDNRNDCALISSRRGTYDRKAFRKVSPSSDKDRENSEQKEGSMSDIKSPPSTTLQQVPSIPTVASTASDTSNIPENRSLAAKFEDYLTEQSGWNQEQQKLILLGESSPLTFALEESPQKSSPSLHDASEHIRDSSNVQLARHDFHPSHLDATDIGYLKAKGCFSLPSGPMRSDLIEAYLTHFHPHYSIVNRQEVENCHQEIQLPWILLHAICFIGATFCGPAVIHRSEFLSRLDARRNFYQKATALFKAGYEEDRCILLQTAIMLSFWGPEMKSHWNPCSWVGFAATFAISLGIHRSIGSSITPQTDKGLFRRLWWALVARDTYCSVLLGRPFQINRTQSDTDMLSADCFPYERPEDAFYQIQTSRLSIILRDIMHCRLEPVNHGITRESIHVQLNEWHLDFQLSLEQWTGSGSSPPFACSTVLELLYHSYIILLFIDNPSFNQQGGNIQQNIIHISARTIASTAITLITKTTVCALPHELFLGFFVAGVVLYRLKQQHKDDSVTQMAQASLDNCRIILNEVQDVWGPGRWAMQIFDFLCVNRDDNVGPPTADSDLQQDRSALGHRLGLLGRGGEDRSPFSPLDDDILLGSNWGPVVCEDFTRGMETFLPLDVDGWSFFQPHRY